MTIKEKILKIMALALEIDPPEISEIGVKRTAVFVTWSPHCNLLSVSIYYKGWGCEAENCDEEYVVFCDYENADQELDEILDRLKRIKAKIESEGNS